MIANIYISNHALQRYRERFGAPDMKILKSRFLKSKIIKISNDGTWEREYGRIIFRGVSNDKNEYSILTIIKR